VSGLVTVTVTFPAVLADVTQLRVLPELKTATPLQVPPPMVTVAPVRKLVPEITTSVPPAMGPELGAMPVTVRSGGAIKLNPPAIVAFCPFELVTTTSAAPPMPTAMTGVVQTIFPLLNTVTFAQARPAIVTAVPAAKPVPLIVMAVPPVVGPLLGAIPVTVGGVVFVPGLAAA
jgi:hypothetical protein